MFPLGHIGIGTHLLPARVRERLPWRWLALGCLLPDLLDKPLWAALQWSARAGEVATFATARLFGHTVFFAALVAVAALAVRRPGLRALAYAVPTHLLLDVVSDYGMGGRGVWRTWLCWPWHLRVSPIFASVSRGLQAFSPEAQSRVYIVGELIGLALLIGDLLRRRRITAR